MQRIGTSGHVLGSPPPGSPEWLAARRGGITATDIPKILGLNPYEDALAVWHDKRGTLPDAPAGEAAYWGTVLEEPVARAWAERAGVRVRRVGIAAHAGEGWRRASLDRVIIGTRGRRALEVKTRSAYVAGRWASEVPDDVLAQVAWQRASLGLDVVHIAVLIGGQELREFAYEQDSVLEDHLLEHARRLWRCVMDGVPPLVDESEALARVLDRLHPDRAGTVDIDGPRGQMLRERYEQARADARAADAALAEARAAILLALQGGDVLTADGMRVATYRAQTRRSLSAGAVEKAAPELYAQLMGLGLVTETTSRVMRLVGTGE